MYISPIKKEKPKAISQLHVKNVNIMQSPFNQAKNVQSPNVNNFNLQQNRESNTNFFLSNDKCLANNRMTTEGFYQKQSNQIQFSQQEDCNNSDENLKQLEIHKINLNSHKKPPSVIQIRCANNLDRSKSNNRLKTPKEFLKQRNLQKPFFTDNILSENYPIFKVNQNSLPTNIESCQESPENQKYQFIQNHLESIAKQLNSQQSQQQLIDCQTQIIEDLKEQNKQLTKQYSQKTELRELHKLIESLRHENSNFRNKLKSKENIEEKNNYYESKVAILNSQNLQQQSKIQCLEQEINLQKYKELENIEKFKTQMFIDIDQLQLSLKKSEQEQVLLLYERQQQDKVIEDLKHLQERQNYSELIKLSQRFETELKQKDELLLQRQFDYDKLFNQYKHCQLEKQKEIEQLKQQISQYLTNKDEQLTQQQNLINIFKQQINQLNDANLKQQNLITTSKSQCRDLQLQKLAQQNINQIYLNVLDIRYQEKIIQLSTLNLKHQKLNKDLSIHKEMNRKHVKKVEYLNKQLMTEKTLYKLYLDTLDKRNQDKIILLSSRKYQVKIEEYQKILESTKQNTLTDLLSNNQEDVDVVEHDKRCKSTNKKKKKKREKNKF